MLEELRKWRDNRPFVAFEIVMVDGRVFRVPHPEFILVPPGKGAWVYVADEKTGTADRVNVLVISSVRPLRGGGEGGGAGGKRKKKAG